MMRTLVALFSGVVLFVAAPAFAQLYGGQSALTILANPAAPTPGARVTLTAQSPLLDLAASRLTWTVNGAAAGSGQSITITAGKLGSRTTIALSVSGESGTDAASLSIIPTSIDLAWEADSYTPPLYDGRALPSSGSNIRVVAMPHFVRGDGTEIPSSNITFTWKNNGAVLKALSGVGESSATIPAAILYSTDAITVDAQSLDHSYGGEASISIPTVNPQLVLYENSPLFGVLYHQALPQTSAANESETSFYVAPYFAPARSPASRTLSYAWMVNNTPVQADASNPNIVTINAPSANVAQLDLTLTSPSDPFLSSDGSWVVSFAGAGAQGAANAFNQ